MKIKTLIANTDHAEQFDNQVNELLAEGWHLAKREVLPGMNYNATNWARRALYAELVQLDPEPAPENQPLNPIDSLKALRKFCVDSSCDGCLLDGFCSRHLPKNEGPADWELPGEEAEA